MAEHLNNESLFEGYRKLIRESLSFLWKALRQQIVVVTIIVLTAAAAGAVLWWKKTPYYQSELTCKYVNQPNAKKVFGEMLQKLNLLAQSGSASTLGTQLMLSPAEAATIVAIEPKNRAGSPLNEDITEEYQPIYVVVRTTDKQVFSRLQPALVNYLSQSAYQKRMVAAQLGRYSSKMAHLHADMQRVDSIIDAYTLALRNGFGRRDSVSIGRDINIREMFDYKDILEERLINLERANALDSGEAITVMHGFAPPDHPDRGSKKIIAAFTIVGFLLAMGWAVIRTDKKVANG